MHCICGGGNVNGPAPERGCGSRCVERVLFLCYAALYDRADASCLTVLNGKERVAPPISCDRVEQFDFLGTASELVPRIEQYIDAGCRHFICKLETTPDQVATHMEYLAKEVVPHFR